MNNSISVNITELRKNLAPGLKPKNIKESLIENIPGVEVLGGVDDDGIEVMVIKNADFDVVEAVFDDAGISLDEFIMDKEQDDYIPDFDNDESVFEQDGDLTDETYPDYEKVDDDEVFDSQKVQTKSNAVNEKKKDCCPKKKERGEKISLSEALGVSRPKKNQKVQSLDDVIDSICGTKVEESIATNAINKAIRENLESDKMSFLREKLGSKKFNALMESLQNGNKHVVNFNINHKSVDEYSTAELQGLLEKVKLQVEELEKKLSADGINEADSANLNKRLEKQRRLIEMLSDEIDFRNAIKESDDETSELDPFSGVDAVPNGQEEEKKDDSSEESSEEKTDDEKNDDEKNPDEDETVELSQIVVTLASKESAEDLKNDLIEAGIPEDVIEVKSASEDEESDEDEDETSDEENAEGEEKTEEQPAEKSEEEPKTEESVKANGNAVNEADGDDAEQESGDENQDNADAEGSSDENKDENADEPYKVILKDTEYANELASVLQDIWGMEKEEFNNLIGGEIVDDDDSGEEKDDENGNSSSDDNGDAESGDGAADQEDELSAEDIFKGL